MDVLTERRELTVAGHGQAEHHDGSMLISFNVTP
jgi:hypothetical protein